uniref:Uncharacterized protein n=1 Tax=viral metagenome TaxID=1070528 RepID=A0A6C0BIR7_9ZZZZ
MNVSCYQSPTNPSIFCAEITTRNEIIEMFSLGIPHGFEFVNSSEKRDVNIQMIPGNSCIRLLFTRTKDIPEKDQITPYLSYQYNEKMTYIPPHENDEDDHDEEYRQQPYQYISTQHYFTLGVNTVISPIVDEVQKSNLI